MEISCRNFFLTPLTTAGGVEKCIDGRQNYTV
jgi:hypothetical protein